MNYLASEIEVGSEGLFTFPFGNGPERIFENKDFGSNINNINLN